MATYPEIEQVKQLVDKAKNIIVVQADNPDTDSLASALALEHILGDQGKQVHLYCGVDLPTYLRHLEGWDRVENQLPHNFDASIILDTNSDNLLEKLDRSGQKSWLAAKPTLLIDHHTGDG